MNTHPDPRSFDCASEDAALVASETTRTGLPDTLSAPPGPDRHDGWTPARQAAFLRELAATHNVSAAARAVGMSRQSAYKLRTRLQGTPFDKAWEAAFITRFDVLAEAALDRALHGIEVPHFYNGELVGTSRRYDERLTLALLAARKNMYRLQPDDFDPASAFEPGDLGALITRVENGPEEWRDTPEEEFDARYQTCDEDEQGGGSPPSDGSDEEGNLSKDREA